MSTSIVQVEERKFDDSVWVGIRCRSGTWSWMMREEAAELGKALVMRYAPQDTLPISTYTGPRRYGWFAAQ